MRGRNVIAWASVAALTWLALSLAWTTTKAKDVSIDSTETAALGPLVSSLGHLFQFVKTQLDQLGRTQTLTPLTETGREHARELFIRDTEFINSLATWMIPEAVRLRLPRLVQTWFRNYVFGNILYLAVGAVWVYYIYFVFGRQCFKEGEIPTTKDIMEQVKVGLKAMPFYTMLPTVTDYIVEEGWTKAYPRVGEVGLGWYALYFVVYMAGVEFGVYWMHRSLHEIPWAYKVLHTFHHKYNKAHTLSPFAGLAFHPLDGILQALPYTLMLFVVPFHYLTHLMLLFLTGVWTTNIHDCLDGKVEPILGAAYHTIHHTTYNDNYGHYFIYMDWLFGTLVTPEEYTAKMKGSKQS